MGAIDTTYTFAANDIITSTKMNNIIDQTSFTSDAVFDTTLAVSLGKLKVNAQGITSNEMAINSVRTDSIEDLSVTTSKLGNASVTQDKLESSVGVSRATLKLKKDISQTQSAIYTVLPVAMSISVGSSPYTVTVTSATPHGYSIGEPFFIYIEATGTIQDQLISSLVDSIINVNSFTFKTLSPSIPAGVASICFINPLYFNSRNIKKVHPGKPVLNYYFDNSGYSSFGSFVVGNILFNATFSTPLSNVDNACIIGSDSTTDFVVSNWFYFSSPPRRAYVNTSGSTTYYNSSFSVAVFT